MSSKSEVILVGNYIIKCIETILQVRADRQNLNRYFNFFEKKSSKKCVFSQKQTIVTLLSAWQKTPETCVGKDAWIKMFSKIIDEQILLDSEYNVKDGFRQLLFVHVLMELEQMIHRYRKGLKMETMKELVEIASYQWHISLKLTIFEILIKLGKQIIVPSTTVETRVSGPKHRKISITRNGTGRFLFIYFLICYLKSFTLSNERKKISGYSHLAPYIAILALFALGRQMEVPIYFRPYITAY